MNLSDKSKTILVGAIISLSTLMAYWNIQYNSLISFDDVKYLIENEHVRSGLSLDSIRWALTATYDANWFPLTWLSHMLDMTLFGSNPLGHHLENLFLHIVNALLLMCILIRLTGRIWRSAAVALLFALHPLHVESVAWAAERKDVLSTLFFFLTIRSYIAYVTRQSIRSYWAALILYLCGLATKSMLVSLPLVLLLFDFWPLRRIGTVYPESVGAGSYRMLSLLREKIPFLLLSTASCVITYIVQRNGGAIDYGATSSSLTTNLLHVPVNYATYLRMIFWPVGLGVIYPYMPDLQAWVMAGCAVLISGASLLAVVAGRRAPYIAAGWFWFLVTTAPVAGFVRIGTHSVADRYTYIPSIGIFIILAWLLADILSGKRYEKVIAGTISIVILAPLAAATWKQTTYWKDSTVLFEHTVKVTENNWVAHNNLGAELLKYYHTREALTHIQEVVRINPTCDTALFNLGVALNRLGDRSGAITAFHNVIKINPFYTEAYFEVGRTYYQFGDKTAAYEIYSALAQFDQDKAEALKGYYAVLDQTP